MDVEKKNGIKGVSYKKSKEYCNGVIKIHVRVSQNAYVHTKKKCFS